MTKMFPKSQQRKAWTVARLSSVPKDGALLRILSRLFLALPQAGSWVEFCEMFHLSEAQDVSLEWHQLHTH